MKPVFDMKAYGELNAANHMAKKGKILDIGGALTNDLRIAERMRYCARPLWEDRHSEIDAPKSIEDLRRMLLSPQGKILYVFSTAGTFVISHSGATNFSNTARMLGQSAKVYSAGYLKTGRDGLPFATQGVSSLFNEAGQIRPDPEGLDLKHIMRQFGFPV